MTKNQTKKAKPSSPTTYTPFYLVMLIISTIGAAFSVSGLFESYNLVSHFSVAPLYVSLMLVSVATIPVFITALILLYQKRKLGLILTLSMFAVSFLVTIGLLVCVDQAITYQLAITSPTDIDAMGGSNFFQTFMSLFWTVGLVIGQMITLAMAVLWHYAWQKQQAVDKKRKA